jgi:hypothetical protein
MVIIVCIVSSCNLVKEAPETSFTYKPINSSQEIEITGFEGPATKINIPDSIDGKPVTSIVERAFYGCYNLPIMMIGNSVNSIGEGAFSGCTDLIGRRQKSTAMAVDE